MQDDILLIDDRISKKVKVQIDTGVIVSVGPTYAKVRIDGSPEPQRALYDSRFPLSVDNSCLVFKPKKSATWIIGTVFSKTGTRDFAGDPGSSFEISPPDSVAASASLLGTVLVSWNAPPQQSVTFEVQTNTSASETGATTYIMTRGGYAIIPANATVYARVRSVDDSFSKSSWSDWVSATPVADGTVTSVGLSVPSIFTVSGSPVTTTGTLAFSLNSQSANTFLAAPNGSSGTPTFRAPVLADLPKGSTSGQPLLAQGGSTAPAYAALNLAGGSSIVTGTLPVGNGGTGQTTVTAAFNALAPGSAAKGDLIVFNGTDWVRKAVGTNGYALVGDSTKPDGLDWVLISGGGGGTVTSVDITVPSFLSVSGNPITTSGTFAITLATETANTIFAGPTSGGVATPAFRSLVDADGSSLWVGLAPTTQARNTIKYSDSATNAVSFPITLGHNSSGTPTASFGTGISFQGQTSTTPDIDMATIEAAWTTATHASRAGQLTFNVMDVGTKRQAAIVKINTSVVYWDIGAAGNTNRKFQVQAVGPTMIGSGFFALDAATTDQTYIALTGNMRVTLSSGIGANTGLQGSLAVTNNTGALTGLLSAVAATSDFRVASTGEIRNAILFQGTMSVRGAGTITNSYGLYLSTPTAQGDSPTWTTNYGIKLFDQVVTSGTGPATSYAIMTGTGLHSFGGGYTKASATSATWDGIAFGAATLTLTGTTAVTTATGVNYLTVNQPTLTDSSSVTVTNAATVYIANAPAAGGSVTITNPYALWVDNGTVRIDGTLVLNTVLGQAYGGTGITSFTAGDILVADNSGNLTKLALGTNNYILSVDTSQNPKIKWIAPGAGSGVGTVSSVDMTVPGFLSVTGNPITTSGTLAVSLANQNANLVFAGPSSGSPAAPTFRALVAADLTGLTVSTSSAAFSSRPGSPSSGDLFFATDTPLAERHNGSTWKPFGPIYAFTVPPLLANWTWVNQGSITTTESKDHLVLHCPTDGGSDKLRYIYRTAPNSGSTYTVIAAVQCTSIWNNYGGFMLGFRESSSGKVEWIGFMVENGTGIQVDRWNSQTSFSANVLNASGTHPQQIPLWWKIQDDGTNRMGFISEDGENWVKIYSATRTTFITADQIIFGVYRNEGTYTMEVSLLSWAESTP